MTEGDSGHDPKEGQGGSSPDRGPPPWRPGAAGGEAPRSDRARSGPRRILLVDCDMFYVQVARLEDPEGVGRRALLIVGGSPSGRGVVTSASYEVREFGVRSGMPTSRALRLCPNAAVVPVSRKACTERSRQVRRTLEGLAPVVQAASIDEFYLDLSGTERLLHDESLEDSAWRIRRAVGEATGISVSVGGGTRKLIAKLAAGRAKPGGVHIVPPGAEGKFMRSFQLREIPGVGPSLADALRAKGLVRVEDLLAVDQAWLGKWFGEGRGEWLWHRARGLDHSPVLHSEPRKSVSSERTFPEDIRRDEVLENEILKLAISVGSALRKAGSRGRTVTVKIRDEDFRTRTASHTFPMLLESDAAVYQVSRTLLRELRRSRHKGVRLLGVGVSSLQPGEGPEQLELFDREGRLESERQRKLSRVVDDLKRRFGERALLPGSLLDGIEE